MTDQAAREQIAEMLRAAGKSKLPGYLGFELIELSEGSAAMRCEIQEHHGAPNGYLHAGTVIALADTAAGYGCVGNMPQGGTGFTTIELKANFLGTSLEGALLAKARMLHGGRTTQVWDVTVTLEDSEKVLAHFRCTQLVLYQPDKSIKTP